MTCESLVYGDDWAVNWGPLERGDIVDRPRHYEVIAADKLAAIIQFAAFAYVGKSVTDPGQYYRSNVAGSPNPAEATRVHAGQFSS